MASTSDGETKSACNAKYLFLQKIHHHAGSSFNQPHPADSDDHPADFYPSGTRIHLSSRGAPTRPAMSAVCRYTCARVPIVYRCRSSRSICSDICIHVCPCISSIHRHRRRRRCHRCHRHRIAVRRRRKTFITPFTPHPQPPPKNSSNSPSTPAHSPPGWNTPPRA